MEKNVFHGSFIGKAVYYPEANINTDVIFPKDYLKTISSKGLGKFLFAGKRYNNDGSLNKDFIINRPEHNSKNILITGENFGCGSSREHAVWSLVDYGFKVIIAPSFADIFFNNCFYNGLLPIKLEQSVIFNIVKYPNAELVINIRNLFLTNNNENYEFYLEKFQQQALMGIGDTVVETMKHMKEIEKFRLNYVDQQPWLSFS